MTRNWHPRNGRELLDQRKRGELPTSPVHVVMDVMHREQFDWPALYLRSEDAVERMDWRALVNTEVWVWADATQPLDRIVQVVRDIADVCPRSLTLRFAGDKGVVHDVDCGSGTHRAGAPQHGIPPEHSFLFYPVNSTGSAIGRRFCRALMPLASMER
ncbi:hypothetical protein BH10PSE18_BH10PSE18_08100 [soil metagenome]